MTSFPLAYSPCDMQQSTYLGSHTFGLCLTLSLSVYLSFSFYFLLSPFFFPLPFFRTLCVRLFGISFIEESVCLHSPSAALSPCPTVHLLVYLPSCLPPSLCPATVLSICLDPLKLLSTSRRLAFTFCILFALPKL